MPEANPLASLALLLWIPLTLLLFAQLRPAVAASISIIGSTILLPAGFAYDFKGLPAIDRELLGVFGALLGCALFARDRLVRPGRGFGVDALAAVMIAGGFLTAYTNADPLVIGGKSLPGVALWGGVSRAAGTILTFWLPLYLGRALFRTPRDLRILILVLAVAGILYSLPVLWESRMSPQLHRWVYGYTPASFAQAKRPTGWGWRPMAFVGHGLALAQFLAICAIAAAAAARLKKRFLGFPLSLGLPWIYFVLLMCQSLAAAIYATLAIPLVAFARLRWNRILLATLLVITVTYPALRSLDWFPTERLVDAARTWHEGRAGSLNFRFVNEDLLLTRAQERLWFGWGGFGRERLYDERGKSETTSDGFWIIQMGQVGLVGYLCSFGMILLPAAVALNALWGRRRVTEEVVLVLALVWAVVLTGVDLLPNGFLTTRTLFVGGALLGAVGGWRSAASRPTKPAVPRRGPGRGGRQTLRPPSEQEVAEAEAGLARGLLRDARLPQGPGYSGRSER